MGDIIMSMAGPTGDYAVEALARMLATQTGLIRKGDDDDMERQFSSLPPEARHGLRELASVYATVVREGDEADGRQAASSHASRDQTRAIRLAIQATGQHLEEHVGRATENSIVAEVKRVLREDEAEDDEETLDIFEDMD